MNVVVLGIVLGKNSCSVVELDAARRVLRGLWTENFPPAGELAER
jgi:hypothetical protein